MIEKIIERLISGVIQGAVVVGVSASAVTGANLVSSGAVERAISENVPALAAVDIPGGEDRETTPDIEIAEDPAADAVDPSLSPDPGALTIPLPSGAAEDEDEDANENEGDEVEDDDDRPSMSPGLPGAGDDEDGENGGAEDGEDD